MKNWSDQQCDKYGVKPRQARFLKNNRIETFVAAVCLYVHQKKSHKWTEPYKLEFDHLISVLSLSGVILPLSHCGQ